MKEIKNIWVKEMNYKIVLKNKWEDLLCSKESPHILKILIRKDLIEVDKFL